MTSTSGGIGPYTYIWSDSSAQTNTSATSLQPGQYLVTITDNNGCTSIDSSVIYEPMPIIISTLTSPVSCNGGADGTAHAIPSGGTGNYVYIWSTTPTQTTEIATVAKSS